MAAINVTPATSMYCALNRSDVDAIYAAAGRPHPSWTGRVRFPGDPSAQAWWPPRHFLKRPISTADDWGHLSHNCGAPAQTCVEPDEPARVGHPQACFIGSTEHGAGQPAATAFAIENLCAQRTLVSLI